MADVSVKSIANGRTMRQLITALALLAASLAVCFNYQREIYSRLFGPFPATVDELAALPSLDSSYRRLFEVTANDPTLKPVLLPFRDVTVHKRRGRETGRSFQYFYLVPAKPPMVVRAGTDTLTLPFAGEITEVTGDVRERIGKVAPQIMSGPGISAVMIDVEDPAFSFNGILAIAAVAAPLLLLGLLIRALLRMMDFRRIPAVAALKSFGAPVDQVVSNIDAELVAGDSSTAARNVRLTPSWLLHTRRSNLDLVRLEDLIWVYSSVTTKKIYGLIPYWWSYALHLADRNGKMTAIKGGKKVLPDVATAIMQRVPWVIPGFTDEIEQVFRKDRNMMIAAVERRKQEIAQPQPPAAAA